MNLDIVFLIKKLEQISNNALFDSDDFTPEERRVVHAINESIKSTEMLIDSLGFQVRERVRHGKG